MQRSQVESLDPDVESAKRRERGNVYVELASSSRLRDGAGNVRIGEGERGLLDVKMIQGTARSADCSRDVTLPIVREPFPVQRAEQIEIHRSRLKIDVLHDQDLAAKAVSHVAQQMRASAPHIHLGDYEVQKIRILGVRMSRSIRPPPDVGSVGYTHATSLSETESPMT